MSQIKSALVKKDEELGALRPFFEDFLFIPKNFGLYMLSFPLCFARR